MTWVAVYGPPGVGKTTLVQALRSEGLVGYDTLPRAVPPLTASPAEADRHAMGALFVEACRAARYSAAHAGVLTVGSLHSAALQLRIDHAHGRLSAQELTTLEAFARELVYRAPVPHVAILLEASPAACEARGGGDVSLDDAQAWGDALRSLVPLLTRRGCAVYRRNWEAGNAAASVASVRDAVLTSAPLAPSQPARSGAACPRVVEAGAEEGVVEAAWASAQAFRVSGALSTPASLDKGWAAKDAVTSTPVALSPVTVAALDLGGD